MASVRKSLAVLGIGGTSIAAFLLGSTLVHEGKFARAKAEVESARHELAIANVQDLAKVFRTVGRAVEPSVVNIQVTKSVKTGRRALPFNDDMLRRFFPDQNNDGEPDVPEGFGDGSEGGGGPHETFGTGSGVIMEAQGGSGFILTNNHVAGGATEMTVTLSDGRRLENAKVLGTDAKTDLAVLKVEGKDLIPAKWGNSDELERGDFVMAFGSPFGYVGSMTHGIVSALNRQAGILASQQGYENFIQVDAPINPGNSGGPLTNLRGEVVGINTAIASRNGGFQGIGFAIPSNQAKFVYAALKDQGKVVRGWLGVSIGDVAREVPLARSLGYKGDKGVLVRETFPNTPATGKLREEDVITELNGKPVENVQELRNTVAATPPGQELKMKVFRDGKSQDVVIKIGEQPDDLMAMGRRVQPDPPAGPVGPEKNPGLKNAENLGMTLVNPNQELAQRYGLKPGAGGALVAKVEPRSPAAKAGIREGDVITRVVRTPVATAREAAEELAKIDVAKEGVRLYVTNPAGSRPVFVEPEGK